MLEAILGAPHEASKMTALTLRNHRGEQVEIAGFSATEAKNSFGLVLDTASSQGMVAITKRDRRFVFRRHDRFASQQTKQALVRIIPVARSSWEA